MRVRLVVDRGSRFAEAFRAASVPSRCQVGPRWPWPSESLLLEERERVVSFPAVRGEPCVFLVLQGADAAAIAATDVSIRLCLVTYRPFDRSDASVAGCA